MDRSEAEKIVAAYDALVSRAIEIVKGGRIVAYSTVYEDDRPRIRFAGDQVVLSWREYESDYYGGGQLRDETTAFPAEFLFMPETELAAMRARVQKEENEREARLKAAQIAVYEERKEAQDRAEWARLRQKYGP